jgi:hypothetical protein
MLLYAFFLFEAHICLVFYFSCFSFSASNSKRPRSVSWSVDLGSINRDEMGTPSWLTQPNTSSSSSSSSRNVQCKQDLISSCGGVNNSREDEGGEGAEGADDNNCNIDQEIGHITSFRRRPSSLSDLSINSPPHLSLGPRSPPTLAKLADAVERSIHSPTSMLGYIQTKPHLLSTPANSTTTTTAPVVVEEHPVLIPTSSSSSTDKSGHVPVCSSSALEERELSLMKLAEAVHQKLDHQNNSNLLNHPVSFLSPVCGNVNHQTADDNAAAVSSLNVDLDRKFLNIEHGTTTTSVST